MLQKVKSDNKGFTLVELIVVIAILGVLMAVLVPQYIQYVEKSRRGTDLSEFGEVLHQAQIEAASSEDTLAYMTVTVTDTGAINVTGSKKVTGKISSIDAAKTLNATYNKANAVKSKVAKSYSGTTTDGKTTGAKKMYIVFTEGDAGWATASTGTPTDTKTFFSDLAA